MDNIRKKKFGEYMIILYTVFALMIDLLGRILATKLALPIWFDSIGTFLMAYIKGPICGAIVGFSNNIIYGIFVEQQSVYSIVGAFLGLSVGWFAKKKVFETQFMTMTLGMVLAIFSTLIAVIFNTVLYEGMCGNIWGNQVMKMCIDNGFNKYISFFLAQFCVEFLDKLLCVEVVYLMIKLTRCIRKNAKRNVNKIGIILFIFSSVSVLLMTKNTMADDKITDYDAYIQKEYSSEEGLLSGEANDIAQTKDGKLWIGTYAGLFKYDGTKFRLFNDIPSVKNVNCLYVDEEGRLWVGTNDNGVSLLINENVMNVIDEEIGLMSNTVKSIVCDSNGNYYIGATAGLSVVTLSSGVKITKSFDEIKNVIKMSADNKGNVAVVTDRNELYWIKDGELVNPPIKNERDIQISSVYFTENDRLVIGTTDNEVIIFDMSKNTPSIIKNVVLEDVEAINSFYLTKENEIFVCTDSGVAVINNDYTHRKLNTNNFSSSIDNMLIDYQGNLWFSSSRLGLLQMCQSSFVELFPKIGENEVVNTTQKWHGMLYCGTDDGLIIIDENNKVKVENEISSLLAGVRVRCIMADSKNSLWIATTGMGIIRVDIDNKGEYVMRHFIEKDGMPGMKFRNIIETSKGEIIVAGDYGVAFIDGNVVEKVFTAKEGLNSERPLCLLEYKGVIYVGSDGGGITKIQDGEIVQTITRQDGLSSNVILRMVADTNSEGVFIVTSNGLCYSSQKEKIKKLDNFPYSNNYDIVCDDSGMCWVLGSAGIYVAQTKDLIDNKKNDYPLINYKRGFRCLITANSWLYRENDDLYLCCDSGVVKVNMSLYDSGTKSYRMILDTVEIDGIKHEINRVDKFVLSSDMDKIVFEPEVLNYSMNDPYVSVFMEGYDSKENICLLSEMDKLVYSNLKAGTYVFNISILDGIGGNVVESASYTFEKKLEMYQNWWFKVYVVVIAGLVVIWITWFVTRTQTQRTLIRQKYELEYAKKQIEMSNETILSIARTVDAKDSNTSEHSFRVSEYSVAIARRLGFSEEECENLRKMALLHDIGKIGIPDAILNKPARLTDEEYEIMKTHVTRGGEILKDFTMIDNVSVGALYHHERYDGTGYCHGLKGEEIPIEARIIGIADAFDAMTANRVYRKQLDLNFVIEELKRCSGTQFDPNLVKILLSLIEEGSIDVKSLYEKSKEER